MEHSSRYLKKAEKIVNSANLPELSREGIIRNKREYDFIVQYPPPLLMKPLTASISSKTKKRSVSVYMHLPFCTGVCSYCHYVRMPNEPHLVDDYLDALELELGLWKKCVGGFTASSMYFGGGTPTYLNEWQITGLLARLRENIHMSEGIELTFESSPETITEEKLCHLKDIGVNRLSIGIQAFDDHLLLKVCNRGHNVKMAVSAITQAKKVGFKNGVNIDLIYGLPDQTPKGWMQTLSKAKELMPEFITLYHLRIKKGTPMSRFSEGRFPTEHNTLLMYIAGVDYLKDLGYVQIAPDQFALPGYSFQQQEQKWHNNELLGLGVSAYGYVNNTVYHNVRSIQDYGDTVHRGCLPVYIGKRLSKREQMTRAMIFGLKLSGVNRKDGGLDKRLFKKAYGIDAESVFGEILIRLEKLGLIKRSNQHIQLTYKGILFSDEVCSEFYSSEEKEQLHRMGHKYGRGVF